MLGCALVLMFQILGVVMVLSCVVILMLQIFRQTLDG